MVFIIACVDAENGIGLNGSMPWSLKPDMKYFRKMTTNTTIIMGRRTWESIGSKPLPNRVNIVVTSNPSTISDCISCLSLEEALETAKGLVKPIFIIGGTRMYHEAVPFASHVYLTRIRASYNCDTLFPFHLIKHFRKEIGPWNEVNRLEYRFEIYSTEP